MNYAIVILAGLLLSACASFEGAYRGPEKFGKEHYNASTPPAQLNRRVRVVVLTFQDSRKSLPGLDWTRQAKVTEDTFGQPLEARVDIEKAIKTGIRKHPQLQLVSAEDFMKNKEADLIISGRIIKCEAQRNATTFTGQTVVEVTARNEFGNTFWTVPIRVGRRRQVEYRDTGYFDEIDPGKVAAAVADSIEATANGFLESRNFVRALARAQKPGYAAWREHDGERIRV